MRSLAHGAEPQLLEEPQSAEDTALYRLLNGSRSGPAYVEEGSTILSAGVLDYTVAWNYQKASADLRFDRDYVQDPNDPPQDIRAVIMEVTTLHVKIRLSGAPTHGNLIWRWKVVAPDALVDPNPAIDTVNFVPLSDVVRKAGAEDVTGLKTFTGGLATTFIRGLGINPKDSLFGALGNNAADDGPALNAAFAALEPVAGIQTFVIPPGIYLTNEQLVLPSTLNEGTIRGFGNTTIIKAGPAFPVGQALIKGNALLAGLTIENLALNLNNRAGIGLDLTRDPESSIQHFIFNVLVTDVPTNGTGIILDGCEDSTLFRYKMTQHAGATNVTAVKWAVPGGNALMLDCILFNPVVVNGQQIIIRGGTCGPIVADDGVTLLRLEGVYQYGGTGATKANFWTSGSGIFYRVKLAGCYLSPNAQNGAVAFQGKYYFNVECDNQTVFDATGISYAVMGSTTLAASGANPSFNFDLNSLVSGTTSGTPGAGVTSNVWKDATLLNSWANLGAGYQNASYQKDRAGFVILRGNVTGGTTTTNTAVFTLPAGYRPPVNVVHPVQSGAGVKAVTIDSGGSVYLTFDSNSTISFSGIRFQAA